MEIIQLNKEVQDKVLELLQAETEPGEGLRVAVIGGGCSGLSYQLGWDNAKETDLVQDYDNGLKVLVDEKSALYLKGSILSYHNTIQQSGFEIENPSANNTCGCGKSFS